MLGLSLHRLLGDTQWLAAAGDGAVRARARPETSMTPRCHRSPKSRGEQRSELPRGVWSETGVVVYCPCSEAELLTAGVSCFPGPFSTCTESKEKELRVMEMWAGVCPGPHTQIHINTGGRTFATNPFHSTAGLWELQGESSPPKTPPVTQGCSPGWQCL